MKKILALMVLSAFSMVTFAAVQGDKKDEKKSETPKKEGKKKKKDQ